MQIALKRSELKEAIAGLSRVIARRASLPVLEHIRFSATGTKAVATGTDLEQTLSYFFESATVERPGKPFLANLEALKPLVKGPDKDTITLEGNEQSLSLTNPVAGQPITVTLEAIPADEFPTSSPHTSVKPVDGLFLVNLRKAFECVSVDDSRGVIKGVFLDVGDQGSHIVGTDGRRLVAYNGIALPVESCIVPASKFLAWDKLDGEIQIGTGKADDTTWFALRTPRWSYQVRTLPGTFPNYRQILPTSQGRHALAVDEQDAKLLMQVLPRLACGNSKDPAITIQGENGRLVVLGASDAKIEMPGSGYTGKAAAITLNQEFFLEAVKAGFRKFSFDDEQSPIHADDNGGRFVLMPLRMDGPVKTQTKEVSADVPQADTVPETRTETEPKKEDAVMPETNTTENTNPLDKVLAAFEATKAKINEAKHALGDIAEAIKQAVRDQRSQKSDLDAARATLAKLQAIRI